MHDQIGIAADRGCEMGVLTFAQSEMPQGIHGITGASHRPQKTDLECRSDRKLLETEQQLLNFRPLHQIAAGDPMGEHVLTKFLQTMRLRRFVDPVDRRNSHLNQSTRHRFVGEEHEFFDELMGDIVFDALNPQHASLLVEANLVLREVEFKGARLKASLPDMLGEAMGRMQHLLDRVLRESLQNGEGVLVGEPATGPDHRRIALGL